MTEFGALSRVLGHPLFGPALTIAVYAVADAAWRMRGDRRFCTRF